MLKVLELRAALDAAIKAADEHRSTKPDFETRRAGIESKRAELSARLESVAADTPANIREKIEADITALETESSALKDDEQAFDAAGFEAEQARLDAAAADIEKQITDIEKNNEAQSPAPETRANNSQEEINMRNKYLSAQLRTREAREAFFNLDASKNFVEYIRSICTQKRAINNVGEIIPDVWLDVLREELPGSSKLLKHCRFRRVNGNARQPMTGAVPEAVWFEAIGKLNETSLGFTGVEYESYGLGSYIAVPDLYLASGSVTDLGADIMDGLISAIGVGYDKGILYGTNTKMPLGVVTRLAQESDPSDPSINFPWVDYHSTNIITVANTNTGAALFRQLALAKKALKKHGRPAPGGIVWCMNPTTHAALEAEATYANILAVGTERDGSYVMPILNGTLEELDFIPDNNIIVGFFDFYGVAEREGGKVGASDIPLYLQNATVFKATVYADGMPLVPDAFAVIGIDGTSPTTALSFAPDYANMDMNTLTVTAAAHGSASGKTVLTVSGKLADANTLKYKIGLEGPAVGTALDNTWTSLTSGSTGITAAAGTWITVAELDSKSNVVGVGYVQSIPKA